ncbi:MAG: hypothetical protein ACOYMP_10280 [Nodosilinea sp.]
MAVPDLSKPRKNPVVTPPPASQLSRVSLVSPTTLRKSSEIGVLNPPLTSLPATSIQSSPQVETLPTAVRESQLSPQSPAPRPDPGSVALPPTASPEPDGFTYNHQPQAPTADPQQLIAWYNQQDWSHSDLPPLPGAKNLPPLVVKSSLKKCLNPPPALGRLEIIVNSDGSLLRTPQLVASTGYDALDRLGVQQAAGQVFSQAANSSWPNPTLYWLTLQVDYDGSQCPAPAPPQSKK